MNRAVARLFLPIAILGAIALLDRGAARAAEAPLKILRHLTFDATFGEYGSIDTKVAGFDGAASGLATTSGPSIKRHGTITVNVVAATTDGGLVVDVSEDGTHTTPPKRVGISDKQLYYDRNAPIDDEQRLLLHYLARNFVKPSDLAAGTSWVEASDDADVKSETTYRVSAVDAPAKTIILDIGGSSSAKGLNSYDATTSGRLTYDTATLVPIALSLQTRTRSQRGSTLTTNNMQLTTTLLSDSFHDAKK